MRRKLRDSFSQLASERDQLRSLIEQLHEGVIASGEDLTVVVANTRASVLLGQEVREGEPLCDPWPAPTSTRWHGACSPPSAEPQTIRVAPALDHTYCGDRGPGRSGAARRCSSSPT